MKQNILKKMVLASILITVNANAIDNFKEGCPEYFYKSREATSQSEKYFNNKNDRMGRIKRYEGFLIGQDFMRCQGEIVPTWEGDDLDRIEYNLYMSKK